jgi:hypothetical protein
MQRQYLIPSLFFVILLTANSAQAFTLGNMDVSSSLNQKFDADLPIHLTFDEGRPDIAARIASPKVFEQNKLTRYPQVDDLQFKHIGTAIHISSKHNISTPILDFIIEVKGPKALSYHRYKINLNQQAAMSKVISINLGPNQLLPAVAKVNTNNKPVPLAKIEATIIARIHKDNTFGPTQAADSLSAIAKQLAKAQDVPIKTMLMALRRDNPKAFYPGVQGALKLGQYLQLPDMHAPKAVQSPTHTVTTVIDNPAPPKEIVTDEIIAKQLQARVERVEHNAERLQIQLTALQDQAASSIAETPVSLVTPSENSQNATPLKSAAANKDEYLSLLDVSSYWPLIVVELSLLGLLAWIVISLIKIKRLTSVNVRSASSSHKDTAAHYRGDESNFGDLVRGLQDEELSEEMDVELTFSKNVTAPLTIKAATQAEANSNKPIFVKPTNNVVNIKLLNEQADDSAANTASSISESGAGRFDESDSAKVKPYIDPFSVELNDRLATTRKEQLKFSLPINKSEEVIDEPALINIETKDFYQADFDFDFVKPQANTSNTKKSPPTSRYPLNTDNKPRK